MVETAFRLGLILILFQPDTEHHTFSRVREDITQTMALENRRRQRQTEAAAITGGAGGARGSTERPEERRLVFYD